LSSRLNTIIRPALESGLIVIADRYIYTAFARDVARGNDPSWVRNLYRFAPKPDVAFFFRVPIDISLQRITLTHLPNFYESGMDIGLSSDPIESYKKFQSKVLEEYDKMVDEFGLVVIDGRRQIATTQIEIRHIVTKMLKEKFGSRKLKLNSKEKEGKYA
jgi:dTMP kinase